MARNKVDVSDSFMITEIFTAHQYTYNHNNTYFGESHDFWELVVVWGGDINIVAGNTVLKLPQGHAYLHEPMEFHRIMYENSTPTVGIITFNCKNMPTLKSRLFQVDNKIIKTTSTVIKDISEVFEVVMDRLVSVKEHKKINSQIVTKEIELLILNIINNYVADAVQSDLPTARHYSKIVNVLQQNINKDLSVGEIAKICKMTEVNLKKIFAKYSGIGVKKYFNELKVNQAIIMLRQGMSVAETAYSLGFADQNYFSTMFKRITGKTPTYYKNN